MKALFVFWLVVTSQFTIAGELPQPEGIVGYIQDSTGIYFLVNNTGDTDKSYFKLQVEFQETLRDVVDGVIHFSEYDIYGLTLIRTRSDDARAGALPKCIHFSWEEVKSALVEAGHQEFAADSYVVRNPISHGGWDSSYPHWGGFTCPDNR